MDFRFAIPARVREYCVKTYL